MNKNRLKKTRHVKDTALKRLKQFKEEFDLEYYSEIRNTIGRIRKLPPQYNPHK